MSSVELPSVVDPDARHIEFRAYECLECGKMGPIAQAENPMWQQWGDVHHDQTGHRNVYQWAFTRSRGQVGTMKPPSRVRWMPRESFNPDL